MIGFGTVSVRGLRRVPYPPTRTRAFGARGLESVLAAMKHNELLGSVEDGHFKAWCTPQLLNTSSDRNEVIYWHVIDHVWYRPVALIHPGRWSMLNYDFDSTETGKRCGGGTPLLYRPALCPSHSRMPRSGQDSSGRRGVADFPSGSRHPHQIDIAARKRVLHPLPLLPARKRSIAALAEV